ncbi:MAG: hypothetical protein H6Q70_1226 [Firmicutes bacterium]|nr:hypothetical protein [Bacillota bacterium]
MMHNALNILHYETIISSIKSQTQCYQGGMNWHKNCINISIGTKEW